MVENSTGRVNVPFDIQRNCWSKSRHDVSKVGGGGFALLGQWVGIFILICTTFVSPMRSAGVRTMEWNAGAVKKRNDCARSALLLCRRAMHYSTSRTLNIATAASRMSRSAGDEWLNIARSLRSCLIRGEGRMHPSTQTQSAHMSRGILYTLDWGSKHPAIHLLCLCSKHRWYQ